MKINKIKINGFKNVFNNTLNLDDITAVIAFNNYGKSNLLIGIDFANEFIKATSNSKLTMMGDTSCIPINSQMTGEDFEFMIEYEMLREDVPYVINYEFKFKWISDDKPGKITSERLKIKENGPRKRFKEYIRRNNESNFYRTSETGRCDSQIKIEDNYLIINKLLNYDELYYLDVIKSLNNIKIDNMRHLYAHRTFHTLPITLKGDLPNVLNRFGSNIAQVVYRLKEDNPDKYELLLDSFKTLIPTIEDIKLVEKQLNPDINDINKNDADSIFIISEIVYRIFVKEKYNNQYSNFDNLSTGTKRIFLLLTSAILADMNNISIIIFEELENSIHPQLFQSLLTILDGLLDNCRVILTSHSPYLIQYMDLENIYIGLPKSSGVAQFGRVKSSKKRTLEKESMDSGLGLGDYLFDLLIDSYNDEEILNRYMESE